MFQERHERVRQHLVGAVADKNLSRRERLICEVIDDCSPEPVGVGVGVEAQAGSVASQFLPHRIDRAVRRRIGVFIGVQFDQIGQFGLLARNVGRQVVNEGAPERIHQRLARSNAAEAVNGIMRKHWLYLAGASLNGSNRWSD